MLGFLLLRLTLFERKEGHVKAVVESVDRVRMDKDGGFGPGLYSHNQTWFILSKRGHTMLQNIVLTTTQPIKLSRLEHGPRSAIRVRVFGLRKNPKAQGN